MDNLKKKEGSAQNSTPPLARRYESDVPFCGLTGNFTGVVPTLTDARRGKVAENEKV
jgi:hypothetical protein